MIKNVLLPSLLAVIIFNLVSFARETSLIGYDDEIPQFSLPALDSSILNSAQLNNKPTLIYFWAPWCKICDLGLPNLQNFYLTYGDKINVVSIVLSYENIDAVHMKVVQHKLDFPVLFGTAKVAEQFSITAFPTYYLLDKDQKVAAKSIGYSSEIGMRLRSLVL